MNTTKERQLKISEYIAQLSEDYTTQEIAENLSISASMITRYRKADFLPSLRVARQAFKLSQVVLYPFSLEAVAEDYNV